MEGRCSLVVVVAVVVIVVLAEEQGEEATRMAALHLAHRPAPMHDAWAHSGRRRAQ